MFKKKERKERQTKNKGKILLVFVTTREKKQKGRWKDSSTPAKERTKRFRTSSNVVSQPCDLQIKNDPWNKTI